MGDLAAALNRAGLPIGESPAGRSARRLLGRVLDGTLSGKLAKCSRDKGRARHADAIIAARGLVQLTDSSAIDTLIDGVSPRPARSRSSSTRAGQDKLFGFFVGCHAGPRRARPTCSRSNELLAARLKG